MENKLDFGNSMIKMEMPSTINFPIKELELSAMMDLEVQLLEEVPVPGMEEQLSGSIKIKKEEQEEQENTFLLTKEWMSLNKS